MKRRLAGTFGLLVLLGSGPILAGVTVEESKVLDRWTLGIGGFAAGLDTAIRLDSPALERGTTVDLEDDLGFSSSETVPSLKLAYILGKRHQLAAGWFRTNRDSRTTIQEEIDWGDETFPVNADVGAFYDTDFVNLTYTYWFYSSETTALGANIGLVMANISAGLGVAFVGQGVGVSEDLSTDAPVPQLGFWVKTYLGRKFVLNGALGYIAAELEDLDGDALGVEAAIEHRTWKNFGFGLGYAYSNYDFETTAKDFPGRFRYRIDGFQLYGRAAW